MSVKERLLQFLKAEGISASEFSRKMGLSPAYLASMRKSMPEEKVERLVEIFPTLNRDWLLYGEGEMYRPEDDDDLEEVRRIPLIPSYAFAGRYPMYCESVTLADCKKIICPIPGVDVAIRVFGDSMEPRIPNGMILFLQKIDSRIFIPWGSPLVLDTENGSLVKMLHPSDRGRDYVEARSYNPNYPPFDVPLESVYGIYRILYKAQEGDLF